MSILVDPQRDVDRFLEAVDAAGGSLALVLETHLHNDYISGGPEAAERTGADLVLPAAAAPAYRCRPAFHMEDIDLGSFAVRPIHTPGHTPEHTSYLIVIDGEPVGVFSGGSLLVASAGRPDLLGMERADTLARLQYGSVNRLARLGDDVLLLPTHGAGSFCTSSGASASPTSTIGVERATSPVLAFDSEDDFVAGQLAALQPYPRYYANMGPANLMGYRHRPDAVPGELTIEDLDALDGATLIDIRSKRAFSDGHIPGALGLEMSDQVGVWAGWLVPFDTPTVLVADRGQDVAEAAAQLVRIGMDDVRGVFYDMGGWRAADRRVLSHRVVSVDEAVAALADGSIPQLLDVRAPGENDAGALAGSVHRYLPDLAGGIPADLVRDKPLWVMCGSGYRASAAVRWLEAEGFDLVVMTGGGVPDVLARVT